MTKTEKLYCPFCTQPTEYQVFEQVRATRHLQTNKPVTYHRLVAYCESCQRELPLTEAHMLENLSRLNQVIRTHV